MHEPSDIAARPAPEATPEPSEGRGRRPDVRVADATKLNWVDRFCPRWSRPYLRLSRADRPAGTWLLLLPCWWGLALANAADPAAPTRGDLWIAVGCGIGAFLMRGAGCTWNDLTDHDFDGQVARTRSRPLPAGQVSRRQAAAWMVLQALLAFAILLTFPLPAILLGILSLLPVAIYPFMKRVTWWPQIFLGIAFNWGALLAWAAYTGSLGWAPVCLYLAGICWTLFYDTIYAHQDKEDDALIGVRSTARLFAERTSRWLFVFQIAAILLATAAVILALAGGPPLRLVLALAAVWGFGWHLTWQLMRLDIDDPDRCLALFRSNRDAGLILAAGFALAIVA
ncbi:MAG: 4-hydroxybenzoate octaprenyltransferase [Pseudomonadota bacterium]